MFLDSKPEKNSILLQIKDVEINEITKNIIIRKLWCNISNLPSVVFIDINII